MPARAFEKVTRMYAEFPTMFCFISPCSNFAALLHFDAPLSFLVTTSLRLSYIYHFCQNHQRFYAHDANKQQLDRADFMIANIALCKT